MVFNIKKQNFERLEKTHPDLFLLINKLFPDLNSEQKGRLAGLCIEYVIQSDGDVDVFQEDLPMMEGEEQIG